MGARSGARCWIMGHRVFEEVTLGVEQRLDISHSWDLIIWCRIRDKGVDNVVYE